MLHRLLPFVALCFIAAVACGDDATPNRPGGAIRGDDDDDRDGGPSDDDDDVVDPDAGPEDTSAQARFTATMGGPGPENLNASVDRRDGTTAFVGFTQSYGAGDKDALITVVDRAGRGQTTILGGAGNDQLFGVTAIGDGNVIAAGLTRSFPTIGARKDDGLVVRFDPSRAVTWAKYVGSADDDILFAVRSLRDGGVVAVGRTKSGAAASFDAWLIKLTSLGQLAWETVLGGAGDDELIAVTQTPDGRIHAVGSTKSTTNGDSDVLVVEVSEGGAVVAKRALGGPNEDRGLAVASDAKGIYVGGSTASFGAGNTDGLLAHLDNGGRLVWSSTLGAADADQIRSLAIGTRGQVFAVLNTEGAFGVSSWSTAGELAWARQHQAGTAVTTGFGGLGVAADGSLLIGGSVTTAAGVDGLLVRATSRGELAAGCNDAGVVLTGAASTAVTTKPTATLAALDLPVRSVTSQVLDAALTVAPENAAATPACTP